MAGNPISPWVLMSVVDSASILGFEQDQTVCGERKGKLKNTTVLPYKPQVGKPIKTDLKREDISWVCKYTSNEYYAPNLLASTKNYTQLPTTSRMVKIQNTENTKCWWGQEHQELSFISLGNAKWCTHFGKQCDNIPKTPKMLLPYDPAMVLIGIDLVSWKRIYTQKSAHGYW